jgi:hypothetical protein
MPAIDSTPNWRQPAPPQFVVLDVHGEPDGAYEDAAEHGPDREIRWRVYDAQRVEIVVDLVDDTIVSVWITQVNR